MIWSRALSNRHQHRLQKIYVLYTSSWFDPGHKVIDISIDSRRSMSSGTCFSIRYCSSQFVLASSFAHKGATRISLTHVTNTIWRNGTDHVHSDGVGAGGVTLNFLFQVQKLGTSFCNKFKIRRLKCNIQIKCRVLRLALVYFTLQYRPICIQRYQIHV